MKRLLDDIKKIEHGFKHNFRDNPKIAIELISEHKSDDSEYLRKSVGNALRDIGKNIKRM